MSTEGFLGFYTETRNYGATAAFWKSLGKFIEEALIPEETISPSDLDLIQRADSIDQAIKIIRKGF